MSIDWTHYNLNQLRQHAISTYRQGGGSRPDVLLISIDGEYAVLKDHNQADKWFGLLLGPLLAWRESKALSKLANIDGVPNLLNRPDRRSLLIEHRESEQVVKLDKISVQWPDFFAQLSELVEQIHQSGVAHNDLRNPTNTLVTPNGKPVLVDLVACFCQGQPWNWPSNWLFNKFCGVDLSAITKLKSKVAPELITDSDIHAEDVAGRLGMIAKGLGQWVRRICRKLFTS